MCNQTLNPNEGLPTLSGVSHVIEAILTVSRPPKACADW